ncbi:MAG TPA: hypothetical protein VGI39_26415 [Polyangiaceae bacterium]|jgi:hypothetical protein
MSVHKTSACFVTASLLLGAAPAFADEPQKVAQAAAPEEAPPPPAATPAPPTDSPPSSEQTPEPEDRTGGAYTSPTLLFIPAASVPAWNVRAILSTELQSPSDVHAGFRPGLGAELGLPAGFTFGVGTNWVGGDVNQDTNKTDFNLGLSPYAQLRFKILGAKDGQGFLLGVSTTYKFVGFEGDPGEMELALSAQYRQPKYEFGLQGVLGQDFADSHNHDGEVHAYAVYRVVPELALGAAGQVRIAINPDAGNPDSTYDVVGGAIANLTLGHYSVGALAGASTLGLEQGRAGGLGQLFATARF